MTPASRYYKRRAHIGGDLPDWVAVLPNWNERFYESHDALMRAVGIEPDTASHWPPTPHGAPQVTKLCLL